MKQVTEESRKFSYVRSLKRKGTGRDYCLLALPVLVLLVEGRCVLAGRRCPCHRRGGGCFLESGGWYS